MNRHIFGLTLFLVVFKIHFLLYWAFFAPINFYSVYEPPAVKRIEPTREPYKCGLKADNKHNLFQPEVINAVVAAKGKISANVRLTRYNALYLESEPNVWFRLHVFDESRKPVWIGEQKLFLNKDKFAQDVLFEMSDAALRRLDKNKNYYAQIETIMTPERASDNFSYNLRQATEIMFSHNR
jgi:hypothetical protein